MCYSLLDLSATFNKVDLLLSRQKNRVGIGGIALDWFRSYLSGRTLSVEIASAPLSCVVPQGSISGPLLFSLDLPPLGSIFRKYGIFFHCCTDGCQIYVPKPSDGWSIKPLLLSLGDTKAWMVLNYPHFNKDKTEVLVFGTSGAC